MTFARVPASLVGRIKQGLQTADHGGWVLANGRALTTLTASQQAIALAQYGLVGNLPAASGRELVDAGAGALFATSVFGLAATLVQANLPAVTLDGALDQLDNNHNHTINASASSNYIHPGGGGALNYNGNGATRFNLSIGQGGAHSHTWAIPLGGAGTPLPVENPYTSVNLFIFLGV